MAHLCEVEIFQASIIADGETAGRVHHAEDVRSCWIKRNGGRIRTRPVDDQLKITAAGAEAEALLLGEPSWVEDEPQSETRAEIEGRAVFDRKRERELAASLGIEHFGEAWFRSPDGWERKPDADELDLKYLRIRRVQHMRRNAGGELWQQRHAVDALATELSERSFMPGVEVHDFLVAHGLREFRTEGIE
jgi:hypothetical protein